MSVAADTETWGTQGWDDAATSPGMRDRAGPLARVRPSTQISAFSLWAASGVAVSQVCGSVVQQPRIHLAVPTLTQREHRCHHNLVTPATAQKHPGALWWLLWELCHWHLTGTLALPQQTAAKGPPGTWSHSSATQGRAPGLLGLCQLSECHTLCTHPRTLWVLVFPLTPSPLETQGQCSEVATPESWLPPAKS